MRTPRAWGAVVAAVAATFAGAPLRAHADACDDALAAPTADRALMDGCLAEQPTAVMSLGGGWTVPGAMSGFAAVDVPLPARLSLSARGRYGGGGIGAVDLMAGFRLSRDYRRGYVTYYSAIVAETATTRTMQVSGEASVLRSEWVLAGGLKGVFGDGGFDVGQTFQLGIQRHAASGLGTHRRIELYGVMRGSRLGATATWHNAIPPIPWLVFGMEAGLVPYEAGMTTGGHHAFWALVDLGVSYEL